MKNYTPGEWTGDALRLQESQELADYSDQFVVVKFDFRTRRYLVARADEWGTNELMHEPRNGKDLQIVAVVAPRRLLGETHD